MLIIHDLEMHLSVGSLGGLSLLLDVEQYFYMRGDNNAAGVRVLIQHHDEAKELVKNVGYFVSAGFHTYIALSYTMVSVTIYI